MRQRRQYQLKQAWASSTELMRQVVSKNHSSGLVSGGGDTSSTCTTHSVIGSLSFCSVGGRNSIGTKRNATSAVRCSLAVRAFCLLFFGRALCRGTTICSGLCTGLCRTV